MGVINSYLEQLKTNKERIDPAIYEKVTNEDTLEMIEEVVKKLNNIQKEEIKNIEEAKLFYRVAFTLSELSKDLNEVKVAYGLSLSKQCYNKCKFCVSKATPTGPVMNYKKITKINKEYLKIAEYVSIGGEGEPFYYKSDNKGVADIIEILIEKEVKNFYILTAGISLTHVNDKFYLKQLVELERIFYENSSLSLGIEISVHHNFKHYNSKDVIKHYAITLHILSNIFKNTNNVNINLKLLHQSENYKKILHEYIKIITKTLNGDITANKTTKYITINNKRINISQESYILDPYDKERRKKMFCEGNLLVFPFVNYLGNVTACNNVLCYHFLKPFANIFEKDFLEKYKEKRRNLYDYFKNNFLEIIKGTMPYHYCENNKINS